MYKNIRGSKDGSELIKLGCWSRFIKYLITFMMKRYPLLHKIDNLCIDLKHKTVQYEMNDKQEPILKIHSGKSTAYILQDETMDKFNVIISSRNNGEIAVNQTIETLITESKRMKYKMSESNQCQQMEMKSLNDHITELTSKLDKQKLSQIKQMIEKLMTKTVV